MKPRPDPESLRRQQGRLITDEVGPLLLDFIDREHPLVLLADRIDWASFEPHWNRCFSNTSGPRGASARLAAGLLMLKHMDALSDERLIESWVL